MSEKESITLTLSPEEKQEEALPETAAETVQVEEEAPVLFDESKLSEEERKMIDDFSKQIDLNESDIVMQYGAAAQKKMANFSDNALSNVRTKDLGTIGETLTDLVNELKGFNDEEEEKGFFGFFKKGTNKIASLKTKYDKAEVNVNKIVDMLEEHQITLLKDISLLDQLYERNLTNFKELSMYILAGQKKLKEVREHELTELENKAKESGLPEDAQAVNDLANAINRFEKKLHDLELTRTISIQMAPQIRLVQNNDTLMAEKIQSTIANTIPLWKSQMVLALGVSHSQEAIKAQREVTNMTNQLLKKNAETLKMSTIETAKESERGIVDLETLTNTNQKLIETLDEVMRIQTEGRAKRAEAQKELARIESELNKKLMETRI